MAVWVVKGGRHGEYEELFLKEGLIGKNGPLPDITAVSSVDEVRALFAATFPDFKKAQISNHVGQFWSLRERMSPGDLVVLPVRTTGNVAVGRVDGEYTYREDLGGHLRHFRPVQWIATEVPRDSFDRDLLNAFGSRMTIARVKPERAEERILAAIGQGPRPGAELGEDQEPPAGLEEAPDVEAVGKEQVRQFISANFVGHDLARLVGAILEAEGFQVAVSPPGADRGVDILAGRGPLGLDSPRIVVQVKTGQAGIEEFRSLRGLVTSLSADQGLLVAWRGYKGTVLTEAKQEYFRMRLWAAEDLLNALFAVYPQLPDDLRSELPLQRVWALVPPGD